MRYARLNNGLIVNGPHITRNARKQEMPIKEHPAESFIQSFECDCGGDVRVAKELAYLTLPLKIPYICVLCKKEYLLDQKYPRVVTRRKND